MKRTKHQRKRTKFKRKRTKRSTPSFQTNLKKIELILCEMQIARKQHDKKKWKQLDKQLYKLQLLQLKNKKQ